MNSASTTHPAGSSKTKLLVHTILSLVVAALGLAGVLYMIFVEDDPALIPMLMLAAGIGWFVYTRVRMKPKAGG